MSGPGSTLARTSGHVPVTASGPPRQLQSFVDRIDAIDACVLRSDAQRLVVYVDGQRSRDAHHQRGERKDARPCPDVEHGLGRADPDFLRQDFEAQRGRGVQPCAERRGVHQLEIADLRCRMSRNDRQTSDANRAWTEHPHGSGVAPGGRRDRDIVDVDAERARDLFRRDAVGHEGRDFSVAAALGVNCAELDRADRACRQRRCGHRHGRARSSVTETLGAS